MASSAHVSKRDILRVMKLDDDAVGELLTISRAIVNMFELLSAEPDLSMDAPDGNTQNAFKRRNKSKRTRRTASVGTSGSSAATSSGTAAAGGTASLSLLQRVHAGVQVDHLTCPSLFPSLLQRVRSPFDKSALAISRTLRSFHIEPDASDIARCVLYSGEVQRQIQTMFTLLPFEHNNARLGAENLSQQQQRDADPESIEPLRASGVASQGSAGVSSALSGDATFITKLLCRRRGTTMAPSAPPPSNEIMLSVPAVRVRHNKGLNPVVVTITPTHLHVRDPIKDFVQKLPWSHLTSASLGNAPGLHAFIGGSAKQSLANITVGPRHGLLWLMARNEAQQATIPVSERKKLNLTPAQALKLGQHSINLQFSGMNVLKDSPVPVDTSRMTPYHINELWRFELVCECEDDFALFCSFITMIGNNSATMWALPGLQPFTVPQTPLDRPPKIAPLKIRPTTLPEIDAAVPGGLSAWNKQQEGSSGSGGGSTIRGSNKPAPQPVIALSEAFFRMAHTDKYARPVSLRYSTRAEILAGIGSATSHVALQANEMDFCTEHHIGRVEYLVIKQLLLGDPLTRWVSIADVLGHMMVPLRAWNLAPAVKLLKFFCDNGWLERVLVLEPGPRKKV